MEKYFDRFGSKSKYFIIEIILDKLIINLKDTNIRIILKRGDK